MNLWNQVILQKNIFMKFMKRWNPLSKGATFWISNQGNKNYLIG